MDVSYRAHTDVLVACPEVRQGTCLAQRSHCVSLNPRNFKDSLCEHYSWGGCSLPGPSPTGKLAAEPPWMGLWRVPGVSTHPSNPTELSETAVRRMFVFGAVQQLDDRTAHGPGHPLGGVPASPCPCAPCDVPLAMRT